MPLAVAGQYPVWANVLIFLAAAVVVWIAGTRLVRHLDRLAERLGLEQALVGMLLLGVLTSLPEVANCITSASIGNPALAVTTCWAARRSTCFCSPSPTPASAGTP